MTGPEHYQVAINLLDRIDAEQQEGAELTFSDVIAAAQVHATLALAAATALQAPGGEGAGMWREDNEAWERVCSAHRRGGDGRD